MRQNKVDRWEARRADRWKLPCWYSLDCPGDFSGFPRRFEMKLGLREGNSSNPEHILCWACSIYFMTVQFHKYFPPRHIAPHRSIAREQDRRRYWFLSKSPLMTQTGRWRRWKSWATILSWTKSERQPQHRWADLVQNHDFGRRILNLRQNFMIAYWILWFSVN